MHSFQRPPNLIVNTQFQWQRQHIKRAHLRRPQIGTKQKKTSKELKRINATIPGIHNILEGENHLIIKLLWILIIGCNSVMCIYQISDRFQFFLSQPIHTRVIITRNESVKFPAFTFCVADWRHRLIYEEFRSKFNSSYCEKYWWDMLPETDIMTLWNLMNSEDIIVNNQSGTKSRYQDTYDTENIKRTTTRLYYGNCTTISLKNLVPFRGDDYTVDCTLLPYINDSCITKQLTATATTATAIYLFHHDEEDFAYKFVPRIQTLNHYYSISIGIIVRRFRVFNLKEAPCDSVAVVSKCERDCIDNFLKERITCRLPYMSITDLPLCTNPQEASRAHNFSFHTASTFAYSKYCSCPKICEETTYTQNLKFLARAPNNGSHIQYFFETNAIYDIEEYRSYTVIPFLCEVGGNLGLYLGLSIPALVELFQSIITYLYKKLY